MFVEKTRRLKACFVAHVAFTAVSHFTHSINYINFHQKHSLDNHQTCKKSLVISGYSFNLITVNDMFDPRQRTLRPHFLEILVLTFVMLSKRSCHSKVEHTWASSTNKRTMQCNLPQLYDKLLS